ncbi:P-type conjugative transfer protein TrbG [Zophobihabitans entericus]|uniref:P-type conjugative transfer protein TrbG n=1 Tax=Zophobihabitans entericus TaxID=1635327 RepID=A0A6G9IE55_9GAMM|nr:P-type conjugative transfer protein TrbG [Zophobihabitans entericus]QIQ22518.1 P-type conjugative transfer protein TrbG [Zophobihabitans entericus]
MKKILLSLFIFYSLSAAASSTDKLADLYFSNADPKLTTQEKAAIAIAEKWAGDVSSGMKPVRGADGSIKYLFGAQQVSIVCAVMRVCDLALQPGELVNGLHVGDSGRWIIEPAVSGSGAGEVIHVLIKPFDVGLETTLFIATNRRTYNINLKSHRTQYMPAVSFTYPEEAIAKWDLIKSQTTKQFEDNIIPQTGEYLGNLDFKYSISGSASWKPVRVYNDGVKTIIQMPSSMANKEAPTLLVIRQNKGLFNKDETVMVNYRLQGDRYIVDAIFDKAILITGVGSGQSKITITKE